MGVYAALGSRAIESATAAPPSLLLSRRLENSTFEARGLAEKPENPRSARLGNRATSLAHSPSAALVAQSFYAVDPLE